MSGGMRIDKLRFGGDGWFKKSGSYVVIRVTHSFVAYYRQKGENGFLSSMARPPPQAFRFLLRPELKRFLCQSGAEHASIGRSDKSDANGQQMLWNEKLVFVTQT